MYNKSSHYRDKLWGFQEDDSAWWPIPECARPRKVVEDKSVGVFETAYVTNQDFNIYRRRHLKNIPYIEPSFYDSLREYTKMIIGESENGFRSNWVIS